MLGSPRREASAPSQKNVAIFTWNPDWAKVKLLSLEQKIELFKAFIVRSQQEFVESKNENSICLMVAPDLIFSLDSATTLNTYQDYLRFCEQMRSMQSVMHPDSIIIASAINYVTEDGHHYKITAPIVLKDQITYYDKKISTGNKMHAGVSLPMLSGQTDGYFEFQDVRMGLEICMDHQKKTLESTLIQSQKSVDIHILISYGQARRDFAVAKPKQLGEVIFVHVELVSGVQNEEGRTLETANYRVTLAPQKGAASSDRRRNSLVQTAASPLKFERINTNAIASDDDNLSSIRYCRVNIIPKKRLPSFLCLSSRHSDSSSAPPLSTPKLQRQWSSCSLVGESVDSPSFVSRSSQSVMKDNNFDFTSEMSCETPRVSQQSEMSDDFEQLCQMARDSEVKMHVDSSSERSQVSETPAETPVSRTPMIGAFSFSQNRHRLSYIQNTLQVGSPRIVCENGWIEPPIIYHNYFKK